MQAFDIKKEIELVSHSDVARYLRSCEWQKTKRGEEGFLDFYEKDNAIIDLLVDETLPSYKDRLRHTVLSLAHYEERSKEDLFSDIVNSRICERSEFDSGGDDWRVCWDLAGCEEG